MSAVFNDYVTYCPLPGERQANNAIAIREFSIPSGHSNVFGCDAVRVVDAFTPLNIELSESGARFSKLIALNRDIDDISTLTQNWDGEGALPISSEAIAYARLVIVALRLNSISLPTASPNPNGTLSLYWQSRRGWAELEIGRTRHSWIVVEDRRDGEHEEARSAGNDMFSEQTLPALTMALHRLTAPHHFYAGSTSATLSLIAMDHDWRERDYSF